MPELPETETIARDLDRAISGTTIVDVRVKRSDVLREVTARQLRARVTGAQIRRAWRRAKLIVLDLSTDDRIVVQPRFTGAMLIDAGALPEEERRHSTVEFVLDGHRFVVFASDHDQVGNRALGDRPSARLDAGGLAIAAALVLCSPYTPMLFMGEEWGAGTPWLYFTDHEEPELAAAVSRGRTEEFAGHGWADLYGGPVDVPDPQDESTVAASRLDWAEPARPGPDWV